MLRVLGPATMTYARGGFRHFRVGQQYPGDIFLVLSAGTTGMRTDCRTSEGIRQDVAPLMAGGHGVGSGSPLPTAMRRSGGWPSPAPTRRAGGGGGGGV